MNFEEVEYDSVADQRVIISDDDENDYFVADEGRAVSSPRVAAAHSASLFATVSHPSGAESLLGTPGHAVRDTSVSTWSSNGVVAVSQGVFGRVAMSGVAPNDAIYARELHNKETADAARAAAGAVVSGVAMGTTAGGVAYSTAGAMSVLPRDHTAAARAAGATPSGVATVTMQPTHPHATAYGMNPSHSEVTPIRGTSPASEPAGLFSTLTRRFLPSFFQMSRPGSAPLTQPAVANADEFVTAQTSLPPTVSNSESQCRWSSLIRGLTRRWYMVEQHRQHVQPQYHQGKCCSKTIHILDQFQPVQSFLSSHSHLSW